MEGVLFYYGYTVRQMNSCEVAATIESTMGNLRNRIWNEDFRKIGAFPERTDSYPLKARGKNQSPKVVTVGKNIV